MVLKKLLMGGSLTLLVASGAHAEILGLPDGRTADPGADVGAISIEGGYVTGDLASSVDYTSFGGRLNYQASPELTVFADFAQPEVGFAGDFDGNAFGGGVYYHLAEQTFLQNFDLAAKVSYHTSSLDQTVAGETFDADLTNLQVVALASGKEPLSANGLEWYAAAGVQRLDQDYGFTAVNQVAAPFNFSVSGADTVLSAGGGLILPVGPGELYAGVEKADGITFGGGFRFSIQ